MRQNSKGTRPAMLRSIVSLAHDLGMEVIAEGAETETDAIELYQIGCEYAQGFAFGQPISAIEARKLVGAATKRHEAPHRSAAVSMRARRRAPSCVSCIARQHGADRCRAWPCAR